MSLSTSIDNIDDLAPVHDRILSILEALIPAKLLRLNKAFYDHLVPTVYHTLALNKANAESIFCGLEKSLYAIKEGRVLMKMEEDKQRSKLDAFQQVKVLEVQDATSVQVFVSALEALLNSAESEVLSNSDSGPDLKEERQKTRLTVTLRARPLGMGSGKTLKRLEVEQLPRTFPNLQQLRIGSAFFYQKIDASTTSTCGSHLGFNDPPLPMRGLLRQHFSAAMTMFDLSLRTLGDRNVYIRSIDQYAAAVCSTEKARRLIVNVELSSPVGIHALASFVSDLEKPRIARNMEYVIRLGWGRGNVSAVDFDFEAEAAANASFIISHCSEEYEAGERRWRWPRYLVRDRDAVITALRGLIRPPDSDRALWADTMELEDLVQEDGL